MRENSGDQVVKPDRWFLAGFSRLAMLSERWVRSLRRSGSQQLSERHRGQPAPDQGRHELTACGLSAPAEHGHPGMVASPSPRVAQHPCWLGHLGYQAVQRSRSSDAMKFAGVAAIAFRIAGPRGAGP